MVELRIAIAALALLGCGPSLSTLVQHRHYREAICAGDESGGEDRDAVFDAIARDADIRVNVHVVSDAELGGVAPAAPGALRERAMLAALEVTSNALPVDGASVGIDLVAADGTVVSAPATRETLIWATGETSPSPQSYTTSITPENFLRGVAAIVTGGLWVVADALWHAATRRNEPYEYFRGDETYIADAPLSEYVRLAPVAMQLAGAIGASPCDPDAPVGAPRLDCRPMLVVDRHASGTIALRLTVVFASRRMNHAEEPLESRCSVRRELRIELDDAGNLAATADTRFGDRARPLDEL